MSCGIGGGLSKEAYKFKPVSHYKNLRTFFTVESHVDVDCTQNGRTRVFRSIKAAERRAEFLNRLYSATV